MQYKKVYVWGRDGGRCGSDGEAGSVSVAVGFGVVCTANKKVVSGGESFRGCRVKRQLSAEVTRATEDGKEGSKSQEADNRQHSKQGQEQHRQDR